MDRKTRQTAGSCLAGNNKQKAKHAGHYGKNSAKSLFQFKNIIMYIYIINIIVLLFLLLFVICIIVIIIIVIIVITYYHYLLLLLSYIYIHTCVTVCL